MKYLLRMPIENVIYSLPAGKVAFTCTRCGVYDEKVRPGSFQGFERMLKLFERDHRDCIACSRPIKAI